MEQTIKRHRGEGQRSPLRAYLAVILSPRRMLYLAGSVNFSMAAHMLGIS
ncbi:hypothetical protein KSZ_30440 [Dictyobacter formicarum]|uniref:Uncharacterized protein n=1 Tax=Dictyobacter formicarum TaxID=2778368 RepID=A0ABQ3VI40_9CHLR|nr:hypothetical protein KSZ_30440 [Dictyobacter formicarum]